MAFVNSFPICARGFNKTTCELNKHRNALVKRGRSKVTNSDFLITSARSRVDPSDEAFVTCENCGSDELVSATTLIERGTFKVKCSQCRHQWVAKVSSAINIDGEPLLSKKKSKDGGEGEDDVVDDNRLLVKLYISGLGPKVDNDVLRNAVEVYGEVKSSSVVYDRVTRRSRGFGFVTVVGKNTAAAVMDDLSGSNSLGGRRLTIREAIE